MLGNSICFVLYNVVLYKFFLERLQDEEHFLIEFFGDDYVRYRQRVRTWLPFGIDKKVKDYTWACD